MSFHTLGRRNKSGKKSTHGKGPVKVVSVGSILDADFLPIAKLLIELDRRERNKTTQTSPGTTINQMR